MNQLLSKFLTEQVVGKLADEGITGCKEVVCKFANNYSKRRNVGFNVIDSACGSFRDTKAYYSDLIAGREPREMQQAVGYDNW